MKYSKNEEAVSPVIGVILMVVITVIIAAIMAVFAFGMGAPTKAPQANLKFNSSAGNGDLTINHEGGDPLVLKDEQITVTDAATGASIVAAQTMDTWTGVDTLTAGGSISGDATGIAEGDILQVIIMDVPSGQLVVNTRVVVTA